MTNYKQLIDKYSDAYVNGEIRSKEYEKQIKQKQRVKARHLIAEDLFNEVPFELNTYEKEHVHHLIDVYPNFRELHGRASNETIILALIFYTKISTDTDIKLYNYQISGKYNLTHTTFELIICRLALNYLKEVYIIPRQPKKTDHEIVSKGKIK
jgi:hypothetical protein